MAMASEPGRDVLVAHHLRVLMARPTQRHHEHPGLEGLTGVDIGDHRSRTEIDLGGFARREMQPEGHIGGAADGNDLRKRWTAE